MNEEQLEVAREKWEEITGKQPEVEVEETEEVVEEAELDDDEEEEEQPAPKVSKRDKILRAAHVPQSVLEKLADDDELGDTLGEWAEFLQRRHVSQERAFQERGELRRKTEDLEEQNRTLRGQLAEAGLTPEARKLREVLGSDYDQLDDGLKEKLSSLVQPVQRQEGNEPKLDPTRREVLDKQMARLGKSFPDVREASIQSDILDQVEFLARDPYLQSQHAGDPDALVRAVFDTAAERVYGRRPGGTIPEENKPVRKKRPSAAAGVGRTTPNRKSGGLTTREQQRVIWNEMQKGKSIAQARHAAGLPPEPGKTLYAQ